MKYLAGLRNIRIDMRCKKFLEQKNDGWEEMVI